MYGWSFGEWWFNKSVRAILREEASGVTLLSISAANEVVRERRNYNTTIKYKIAR